MGCFSCTLLRCLSLDFESQVPSLSLSAMKFALLGVVAVSSTGLAMINCTTKRDVKTYCCPSADSQVAGTIPGGSSVLMRCAVTEEDK